MLVIQDPRLVQQISANISELNMTKRSQEVDDEMDSGLSMTDDNMDMEEEIVEEYNMEIVWSNIIKFIILHLMGLYSLSLLAGMSLYSWAWLVVTYLYAGAGITAGAHRLWSHRTYKAKLPLRSIDCKRSDQKYKIFVLRYRLLLLLGNSMAGENSVYTWCRDHRTHHKYSETEADPHNATVRL